MALLLLAFAGCGPPQDERGSEGLEGLEDTLAEDSAAFTPEHDTYPAPGDPSGDPDSPVSRDTLPEETGRDGRGGSGEGNAIALPGSDEDAPGPDDLPPWTVDRMDSAASGPGVATVTALDQGRHPGYDRWVLHFDDGPIPGWEVEYVDRPLTLCGSGRQILPVGEGWLRIDLEPARGHTEAGEAIVEPETATPGLEQGLRVYRTCDFEGQVELVLALRSPEPFRAFELRDPARLVVDVRTGRADGRP